MDSSRQLIEDFGRQVRLHRLRAACSASELARVSGLSQPKISRLENGIGVVRVLDAERLAAALRLSPPAHDRFVNLARLIQSVTHGRGRATEPVEIDPWIEYRDIELAAQSVDVLTVVDVPVLLRTPDRLRHLMDVLRERVADKVDTAALAVVQRQAQLHVRGKRFRFVIGQSSLQQLPPRSMSARQLDALLAFDAFTNVEIRLLPAELDHDPSYTRIGHDITVLDNERGFSDGPFEVHEESPSGSARMIEDFALAWDAALGGDEFVTAIEKALADC